MYPSSHPRRTYHTTHPTGTPSPPPHRSALEKTFLPASWDANDSQLEIFVTSFVTCFKNNSPLVYQI